MKLSLLLELPEGESLEALTSRYQAELEAAVSAERERQAAREGRVKGKSAEGAAGASGGGRDDAEAAPSLTLVPIAQDSRPLFARQVEALPQASGCFIAAFDPHVSTPDGWLSELVTAHLRERDPDMSAVFSERRLPGALRIRRLLHRGLYRVGGRRSPPREAGTAVLFDRRWSPALAALPSKPELELPLALAAVGAEWRRVWHQRALSAPLRVVPFGERFKIGFRRLSWLGGLRELGMLTGLGLYGLCGVLIVSGPRSAWEVKGAVGVALVVLLTLVAALVQWFLRRPLQPALALGSETVAEIESHRRAG